MHCMKRNRYMSRRDTQGLLACGWEPASVNITFPQAPFSFVSIKYLHAFSLESLFLHMFFPNVEEHLPMVCTG